MEALPQDPTVAAEHRCRAVVATGYGGPEVLAVVAIDRPTPGPGQVLVEVHAASANPYDHKVYSGAFGSDPNALPLRLGSEVAGVVAEVGEPPTGFAVGDPVIAHPVRGGYACHVLAEAANVFALPGTLPVEQAAGLLLTGTTAAHLLAAVGGGGDVGVGDTVLVHGAAGGVGSMATQLAVVRGARVIGTASPARQDAVRALGGEPVAYGRGETTLAERVRALAPDGIDAALDTVGTDEAIDTSLDLVADRRRIATIAAFGRAPALGIHLLGHGPGADPGTALRAAARADLVALAAAGRLAVTVDRVLPLEEVAAAHAHLASGHARGKVILRP